MDAWRLFGASVLHSMALIKGNELRKFAGGMRYVDEEFA
jgi:hypothetical protein